MNKYDWGFNYSAVTNCTTVNCYTKNGCLTGEHGVGIEKRDLMYDQFTAADLEAQLRVKDVFDPKWLLNPAKVFPLDATAARRASQ